MTRYEVKDGVELAKGPRPESFIDSFYAAEQPYPCVRRTIDMPASSDVIRLDGSDASSARRRTFPG